MHYFLLNYTEITNTPYSEMLLWTFQSQLWTSVFIRISSNQQQKFLVLRKMVQHLWQLKLTQTSAHWATKHITEWATGQKPSIRIFTFLPQVPLTQELRDRLHPIHIQHLGAPSPFSSDMSCGKAGIINVTRGSIWTATWRDQRVFPQTAETVFTQWPTVWSKSVPRSIRVYQSQRISQYGSTGLQW
jgi:hypothetical protein